MDDEEEIEFNFSVMDKIIKNLDWRDLIIISLAGVILIIYLLHTREITACNNYYQDLLNPKLLNFI